MTPFCGWCHANGSNMLSIYNEFKDKVGIELKVGRMWFESDAPYGGEGLSDKIRGYMPELTAETGFKPSEEYYKLLSDSSQRFNSKFPSAAITAVKAISPENVFEFSVKVQEKFFDGNPLNEESIYSEILDSMAIDFDNFKNTWLSDENLKEMSNEFVSSDIYAELYPTLVYKEGDHFERIAVAYFEREKMRTFLNKLIQ
jgi:protein-disulfide isomerase-like protein with CxxC motif